MTITEKEAQLPKRRTAERRRVLVDVPGTIKRAVQESIEAGAETNLNDAFAAALAEHYETDYEQTGKPGGPANLDDGKLMLRLPAELKRKVAKDALRRDSNLRDTICAIVARKYGVPFEERGARSVPFGGGAR